LVMPAMVISPQSHDLRGVPTPAFVAAGQFTTV